jgi:hypothetical protein
MKRIGIVGENYQNDACAFGFLMTPQYKESVEFIPIVKEPNKGTNKLGRMILSEMENKNLDAVICLKDLDTYPELTEKERWFNDLNKIIQKGIFYLVVIRYEALLLADMEALNQFYKTKGKYLGNPIKELLPDKRLNKEVSNKYNKNHCSEICQKIDFKKVYQAHTGERSFQAFIKNFNQFLEK